MAYPKRLFKYLPSKYVERVINKGEILFRNFTYFKQIEGKTRGDYLEACHRDNPNNKLTLTNVSKNISKKYDASFLNSTNSDYIFMFCTSKDYRYDLYAEFESDVCIEITNPEEFARRLRRAIRPKPSCHKRGLLCEDVFYYCPATAIEKNIKDASVLPFLKDNIYEHQSEYRFVFGTRRAFELNQQIVLNGQYDFRAEAMKGITKEKLITIGSINDIAQVHKIT